MMSFSPLFNIGNPYKPSGYRSLSSLPQPGNVRATKDEIHFQGNRKDNENYKYNEYINRQMISGFKDGKIKASDLQSSIQKGADINAQDEEGNTVLHHAVSENFFGNGSISDFTQYCQRINNILSYKPNVNIINNKDETPLSIVIHLTKFTNWHQPVQALLANGAFIRQKDISTLDKNGKLYQLLVEHRAEQLQTSEGIKAYDGVFPEQVPDNELPKQEKSPNPSVISTLMKYFKKTS